MAKADLRLEMASRGSDGMTPTQELIVGELYKAMKDLGAPPKLLGVVGSWGDTLSDADVLAMLRAWNEKGELEA